MNYKINLKRYCFFTIICSFSYVGAHGFLLQAPLMNTQIKIEQKFDSLPMVWTCKDTMTNMSWKLGFDYHNGSTRLKFQITGALPNGLSDEEIAQFTKVCSEGQCTWIYVYGQGNQEENNNQSSMSMEDDMGTVGAPLVVSTNIPKSTTITELAQKIAGKRVAFYTGAGISAGVVLTMSELVEQLGLDENFKSITSSFIQRVLNHPESFIKPMDSFYKACLYGEPTKAHVALCKIVQHKNWGVLTENLDQLHQRSGIDPLNHSMPDWLKFHIHTDDLQKLDAIITVGLASDESGFLGWYKKHNPCGIIIAINLCQPNYLDVNDYVLIGDAQTTLPDLWKNLKNL